MSDQTFKIGEVVALKSGGPSMTVKGIRGSDSGESRVECQWYDHSASAYNEDVFIEACLTRAE